jgi:hypothetical protein
MKRDPLKQFVALRDALLKRKQALEVELNHINRALAVSGPVAVAAPVAAAPAAAPVGRPPGGKSRGRKVRGKRARNSVSLKEAVLGVTKSKPLSKPDILAAVSKSGYVFTAVSPMNSLNTLLYSDKAFKNHGGKFGPA